MRVPLRRFSSLPWFVDPSARWTTLPSPVSTPPVVPADAPGALKHLHSRLSNSPHLDLSTLVVCQPRSLPPGPPLPTTFPKGRRRRGRTYGGEGIPQSLGGIWNWIIMAQVKEGTENRGAVESVVRLVRKTLLTMQPPLLLPPNSKGRMYNGWAMIDAGDFAVHVLSRRVREKYFENIGEGVSQSQGITSVS